MKHVQRHEQTGVVPYQEEQRHQEKAPRVAVTVHPLVFSMLAGMLCIISLVVFLFYVFAHKDDLVANSVALAHDGFFFLHILGVLALCAVGAWVCKQYIKVAMEFVLVLRSLIEAMGQRRRNKILVEQENYTVVDDELAPVFYQVSSVSQVTTQFAPEAVYEDDLDLLPLPVHTQPSQDSLLGGLEENTLTVSPGIQASNGEMVKVSLVDIPHLKIIGSTGFGKSCLAGAILDQATQLNAPDMFHIALLDLEHKTSRLFEDVPHVAHMRIGNKLVQMVATTADEVAEYLGYLKRELDRRATLSEDELSHTPVLLMYVEEMLSLQYEIVDPKLLKLILADITVLAVRGRKYGMFLLACMQTDYSTREMQITQKMFRFRSAAAIDTSAARAAGFMNTELIKENFATGKPGQFVVEYPSFSDIVLAPMYDVKRLLARKSGVSGSFNGVSCSRKTTDFQSMKPPRNASETIVKIYETTPQADFQKYEQVRQLRENGWGKVAIIEKVWRVKAGATQKYKEACVEYEHIVAEEA